MNQTEDLPSDQSEVIVKTVKEVCAEGLVVSGGGQDGIFIKEVKPESPASKHLNAKERDQILSATVYFDNVSYEDALQILEHAQPYKVAFCLKRKPPPRTQEAAETMRPDITIGEEAEHEEERGGPEMRGRRKTKKQHDRISWPKFPTFSKGRRAHFKRSHSTSEAEEQRKLEISPPTSDTESPLKSPFKSPDGKDKKKMHKMKLKMKMAGRRSKSVEETENEEALTTDNMDNQIIMNITEEQAPVINVIESPKILNEAEKTDLTKTRIDYTLPNLPVPESLNKVELISLDTTLKTTDITVTLEDDGKEKIERSELKVSISGKDKCEIETESLLKSSTSGMRTSDASTIDNIMDSPNIISQTEAVAHQVESDSKPIIKEITEKLQESGETNINIPTVAIALDVPDVGATITKSPKLGGDKEKKERNILETESYGIRTRGPLADIATSKSHFANTVSGLEFASSDTFTFEIQTKQEVSSKVIDAKKPITSKPVVSQPKSQALEVDLSKKSTGGSIDTTETKKSDVEFNFKLPRVDLSKFDQGQSITIGLKDPIKVPLLKREEIVIPGMEDKKPKAKSKAKSQRSNEQKIEKIINISKAEKPRAQGEAEEFNVEDVKEAVSKFPAFKLPDRDITGVLVQREITFLEMKTDKTGTTPKGSPSKVSSMSTEINIKLSDTVDTNIQSLSPVFSKDQATLLPKTEEVNLEETVIAERKTAQSKTKLVDHKPKTGKMLEKDKIGASHDVKIKLPKREDIEIPGMEAIEQIKKAKDIDNQVKDYTDTDAKADRKGHEKKSKKGKVSLPSFGIMTPDIRFPGIAIELPIKAMSTKNDSDAIKDIKTEQKSYDADIEATKQSSKEATLEKPKKGESCVPEIKNKEAPDIGGDQILHHGISTAIKVTSKQGVEGEPKAEIKSTDTDSSPHKKKLPKLKMPKLGGKSVKGITEVSTQEDVAVQENDVVEVVLDSEKRTSKTDPKGHNLDSDKNWPIKMPSIDVSVPKIKIPKTEGKSKQEETYTGVDLAKDKKLSESTEKSAKEKVGKIEMRVDGVENAQEESGFRLIKFGISLPKGKTEEVDLLPEESDQSVIKAVEKTKVEPSELPQGEIKEPDSKMKKRKISFPKFGFSKSESKASDSDVTLPPSQDTDGTETDVGSKTTDLEAEFKDSTESPTKFRLPTIRFPKFGVSIPKTTDASADIHIPDVSTEETTVNVELPEAKLSVESTTLSENKGMDMPLSVCKPKVDLSLPEGKVGIKDISIPKVDDFQKKTEADASITGHDVEISKKDIKDDISPPQVDAPIPEASVEIKVPEVDFTTSKEDAEDKNITGGAPIKIKLPSIHLPTFGGKSSKVKDMPDVDIDVKGLDVSLPETEVNVKLKDDAPSFEVKDSFVTMRGVDMKVEEAKLKDQDVMVTLPKFGISLPKVQAHKQEDITDKESSTDTKESKPESDQAEKGSRSPTKVKLPTFKFPKIGVSYPKSPDVDLDNQVTMVNTDEPTIEFKEPSGEIPALPKLKTQHITLSVSKPEVDVSMPKGDKTADAHCEKKKEKILSSDNKISKSEVKTIHVDHDLDQKTDLEDLEMQGKQLDMKIKLPSGTVDVVIPEAKEKESETKLKKRKISFPKFGFSKSDTKVPDVDTNLQGTSVQEIETEVTVPAPELEVQMKNKTSGSPSKFKLPTISLPKFDISISKMEEESTAKADEAAHEVKVPSGDTLQDQDTGKEGTEASKLILETLPENVEIKTKDSDPESQGSKFTMPKFEFSFPKLKGPEFKKGASKIDTDKTEATLKSYMERAEGETEIPEASVEFEVTSASVQAGELDVNVESDLKIHTTDMLKDDTTTGGSPIKFKLPSFKLPKFGSSYSKEKPEITDLKGGEITLKAEEIEASDLKMDFGLELKKPSISVQQPKVLTEAQTSKAEGDISLPEGELWEPSAEVEVPKVKLECKIDQEADLKDTGINIKRPGFSLPKFGFSKPDKVPEIDVNLMQVDFSKTTGDVKINDQSMNITAPSVEQKDLTLDATTKDTLSSINLPKFGGPSIKVEKTMQVVDISVKEPEVSTPDAQVSVDLKVKDAELGGQEKKLKMPKLAIGLPKVKGFELSTKTEDVAEVQPIDVKQPDMTTEGKVPPPEYDSKTLDVQMKTLPGLGFSKPEVKSPEVDVSTQKTDILIPEGSLDLGEANVDVNVSKVECEQKGSTFFGSPTKFKLPSISFPKFGVKSQKVALDTNVTESELEGANIKHDISKPDVKLEIKPSSIEAKVESSTDTPDVDSKEPQVKVKRPSFSFPKFGFSKSDTATPEVDVSVHKVEPSIPETTVTIKEQTAEIALPGGEAEQKDLTSVISPIKIKLPEVNLPKFGVKTSKGTVSLPSPDKDIIEITNQQPDIKVAGEIVKMGKEADVNITLGEADVLPKEEKIILPQLDVDTQDLSNEGKADIPEVDLRGLDVKLKKPSFSFPKFGFSKPDKGQSVDASLPKTEMSIKEGDIPVKEKDVELAFTREENKQEDPNTQTKFRLPSINLPKFGLKYPKATPEISSTEVDIRKPEISFSETGEVQTTDTKINIDIKGPTTDVESKDMEVDIDVTGSKPKLPKMGISMPKVKEMEQESKDIKIETDLLCKEKVNVQQPIEGKLDKAEVDSKGLKVKLPKLGFSKSDLKTPEIDSRLPKADMSISVGNVDFAELSADNKLQEQEQDLKVDTSGSPTRFKLPTVNLPKFGIKASKDTVDISTAHIDTKSPEVSLPDKKLLSGEVSTIDTKELTEVDPSIEIEIKGDKKELQDGKFKIPKFGIGLPTIKGPDSGVLAKREEGTVSGDVLSTDKKELKLPKGSVEVDMKAKGVKLEVEKSKFKLPELGISHELKGPEIDISISKAEVPQTEVKEVKPAEAEMDVSSKGLKTKKPGFGLPKIGFSKSDGKAQDIQASEMTADISLPEGTTEIGESEIEDKAEITSPQFGSPTKFKLPTIKLPKFGISTPKVTKDALKSDSDIKDIKVSSVDNKIETTKVEISGDIKGKTAEIEAPSVSINIKGKEINQEVQESKFQIPKFGISLPKVKGPEVTVTAKEVKTGTPDTGITEPEIKIPGDVSVPKVDIALEGSSSLEKKEVETEVKNDEPVSGSPSKFKLPAFKMPKFGISGPKISDAKAKLGADVPDNADLNIENKPKQVSTDIHREGEIKETSEPPPEAAVKKLDGEKGSPSKFKLPTIKMPKISLSRTKSQDEDDTTIKAKAPEAKTEHKDDAQAPGKSPRFAMPALEDVLRGFEVEFNVPTIEQTDGQLDKPSVKQDQEAGEKTQEAAEQKEKGAQEKSKFKFKFPKLGFSQSSDESDKLVDAKIEESEKHLEALADVKETKTAASKEQVKTEKGGWFKFSFSSPTKTTKTEEKDEITQQTEQAEKPDDVEKESRKPQEENEKSSLSEAVEEIISPTLSLRSSEAFADVSSTVTTDQIALSQTSPTKVKVKYAEPTATVGINDVQSDVVTSTARCELISMEPHQPEKVNIPFSSDMSSTSVDTQKQMSGEIHVITSNIQAVPDTQQAAILTNIDGRGIHASPLQVTLCSDSVLTVEETRVQSGMRTMVERHVVKETLHDDKETILVTQRTRIFEGDSAEPISDETASSIRRLKDTVHTEKMRFFDSVATTEEVTIVSSETTLRHMDSSTDENGGK
ncbi:neuroblast differentiation-associated protein AHNAK-like [Danio rerio]|uniref:Neuroblast differentiation-associated protein AHNAK-like n=1 Tax=Danio rerio TaxID=7955 RepID=A0A8M1P949_DANRE|nr:neuroblast differentiation-associated protein AHNAK-like [Danio rerio]|eukprot:NP_001314785.1 neuroblast differentiation-associated protein AHNAK-like [Danio rerio]